VAIGISVTVLLLFGMLVAAVALISAAAGCPLGGDGSGAAKSATLQLERAVGELPGVVATKGDYVSDPCDDRAELDVTVPRGADPDQVAEVVRVAQAGLRAPEFADVDYVELTVEFDKPVGPPAPADGRFGASGDEAVEDVVADARAWVELQRRYPGASVGDHVQYDWVEIALASPTEAGAIAKAFGLLGELGLDGAGRYSPSWDVGVAPAPTHSPESQGYSYKAWDGLPPPGATAAMESVADWSADLGSEIVLASNVMWRDSPDAGARRLEVHVKADVDRAGRTADELADELAARLDAAAVPYELDVQSTSTYLKAVRSSG
jgi:hypothetical protein